MKTGTIKRLVSERGFGFVKGDDGNDYFFHCTQVSSRGFDLLQAGQSIRFDVVTTEKGLAAQNVEPIQ